jgi:hypothetical protein
MRTLLSHRLLIACVAIVLFATAGFIAWRSLSSPTPPQATCGDIVLRLDLGGSGQPIGKNAQQVEDCFYHAFQHCAAQTINVHFMGVDTGSNTIYWPTMQGNTCRVFAQYSSYGLVSNANQTQTDTCQGVTRKNGGLLFLQCGTRGDFFLAPAGKS